ncbi:MAG: ATP-binding cassette domain-containing protein, partial [Actinomycetota bacterium]
AEPVGFSHPGDAMRAGIVTVAQEMALVADMTVAENIVLGAEPKRGPFLFGDAVQRKAGEALGQMGVRLPLSVPAGTLLPSEQRVVMVAQAIHREGRLIILDEPTAGMNFEDSEYVLRITERLKEEGLTIIYVSHRLDDVVRLCDRVTVLVDGETRISLERTEIVSEQRLVGAMIGGGAGSKPAEPTARRPAGDVVISCRGLFGRELRGVDIDVRTGEVLGIIGLPGSGAGEVIQVVAGLSRPAAGVLEVKGRRRRFRSPADALDEGIGFLGVDRAQAGVFGLPVRTNVALSSLGRIGRGSFISGALERSSVRPVTRQLGIPDQWLDAPLASLSGGNQQRALLARQLLAELEVLILEDPTVSVDVLARRLLHDLLKEIAAQGKVVILLSTDPEELPAVADRVYVFAGGRVRACFADTSLTYDNVLAAVASSGHTVRTDSKLNVSAGITEREDRHA